MNTKKILFILGIMAVTMSFVSCEKNRSYAESVSYTHLTLPTNSFV